MTTITSISEVVKYTQDRVNTWYKNAKIDYNVDGNAYVTENETHVSILFTENDVTDTYSVDKVTLAEEDIDYLFNTWSEL